MRIIGGKLKGSNLYSSKNLSTRPLKDLVRESIFNLLIHSNKISFKFEKTKVLDLYSGTGSFGLECLSREANGVCFVENSDEAIKILKKNVESTFNAITVDSDTSTNDMVTIFSTGKAGNTKIENILDLISICIHGSCENKDLIITVNQIINNM